MFSTSLRAPPVIGRTTYTSTPSWALPDPESLHSKLRLRLKELNLAQKSARCRLKFAGYRVMYNYRQYWESRKAQAAKPLSPGSPSPLLPTLNEYDDRWSAAVDQSPSKPLPIKRKPCVVDILGHLDIHEAARRQDKIVVSDTARFPIGEDDPTDDEVLDELSVAPAYMWRHRRRLVIPAYKDHAAPAWTPRRERVKPTEPPVQLPELVIDTGSGSGSGSGDGSNEEVESYSGSDSSSLTVRPVMRKASVVDVLVSDRWNTYPRGTGGWDEIVGLGLAPF